MTCWLCGSKSTELTTNVQSPSCNIVHCQICTAVTVVDEEIAQAEATLRRLIAKRCDLRSEQNRVHDLMNRLPIEVKNYTFELFLPNQDEWGRIGKSSSFSTTRILTPSYLTSLCKNWRDIAASNPSLWSTIRIKVGGRAQISNSSEFAHDWILRSGSLPLTLHIDVDDSKGSEEEWKRVLNVIGPSSDRWQSLSLRIPSNFLHASHHDNLQYDRLRRLRLISSNQHSNEPLAAALLNSTMSPEEIYISGLSSQARQISWNHLTSATIADFYLEDIAQLFQNASRMSHCQISYAHKSKNFIMPPIVHQGLKALSFRRVSQEEAAILLGSLTLPSLQEFHVDDMTLLRPKYLPALVHRSSCPMTIIKLSDYLEFRHLTPISGITDLVLTTVDPEGINKLLFKKGAYFPDLRRLILRFKLFLALWVNGTIRTLVEGDKPYEGSIHKIVVVDKGDVSEFDDMWSSEIEKRLKAFDIVLREDSDGS